MPVQASQHRASAGAYQNKIHDNLKGNATLTKKLSSHHSAIPDAISLFGSSINRVINSREELNGASYQTLAPRLGIAAPLLMLLSQVRLTGSPLSTTHPSVSEKVITPSVSGNVVHSDNSDSSFTAMLSPVANALYETGQFIARHDPLKFPAADASPVRGNQKSGYPTDVLRFPRHVVSNEKQNTLPPIVNDDVKIKKNDYSCIEERKHLSLADVLRQIGKTLKNPVTELTKESQIIDYYNRLGTCPTKDDIEKIASITIKVDAVIDNILSSVPLLNRVAAVKRLGGSLFEIMANNIEGKDPAKEDILETENQVLALSKIIIDSSPGFKLDGSRLKVPGNTYVKKGRVRVITDKGDRPVFYENGKIFSYRDNNKIELFYSEKENKWLEYNESQLDDVLDDENTTCFRAKRSLDGPCSSSALKSDHTFTSDELEIINKIKMSLPRGQYQFTQKQGLVEYYYRGCVITEVRGREDNINSSSLFKFISINNIPVLLKETVIPGHGIRYDAYHPESGESYPVEGRNGNWIFEKQTDDCVSPHLRNVLITRDCEKIATPSVISPPDEKGIRFDANHNAYIKFNGNYIRIYGHDKGNAHSYIMESNGNKLYIYSENNVFHPGHKHPEAGSSGGKRPADEEYIPESQDGAKKKKMGSDSPGLEEKIKESEEIIINMEKNVLFEKSSSASERQKSINRLLAFDFSIKIDLSGGDLSEISLQENKDMRGFKLERSILTLANLEGANLECVDLSGAGLESANIKSANLKNSDLTECNAHKSEFNNANLENAVMNGINLQEADMTNVKMSGAELMGAKLNFATLTNADLSQAILEDVEMNGVDLQGAVLENTEIQLNLPDEWNDDNLDFFLNHINNEETGSILTMIDSIDPRYADIKNKLSLQVINSLRDAEIDLSSIHESLIDVFSQNFYRKNKDISAFMSEVCHSYLNKYNSAVMINPRERVVNAGLNFFSEDPTRMVSNEFNSAFVQIIHTAMENDNLKQSARVIYDQYLHQEPLRNLLFKPDIAGHYGDFNGKPDWLSADAQNYILLSPRNNARAMMLSSPDFSAMCAPQERSQWNNFFLYHDGHALAHGQYDLTETLMNDFPLFSGPFSYAGHASQFRELVGSLELGNTLNQEFIAATGRVTSKLKLISPELQEELSAIMNRKLEFDNQSSPLLRQNHYEEILKAYSLTQANEQDKARTLFSLSAIFSRYSSSAHFGTETNSPVAIRHYASALMRKAHELSPAVFGHPDKFTSWNNKLLGRDDEFTCTALLSDEMFSYARSNFPESATAVIPPAWN